MKKKIQKPFDIEAARNGAKIETRSGKSVRIICYDVAGTNFPIIALTNLGGIECCSYYTFKGETLDNENDDLVIVEEIESPKFNVGNWVVVYNEDVPRLITAVTSDCYELEDVQGHKVKVFHRSIENICNLWELKNAKPGDVLICVDDDRPFIFKEDRGDTPSAYCGIDTNDSIRISSGRNNWTISPVRPATFNERQQFFDKLEAEGYKWDAESLTLSKIHKRWRDDENAQIDGYFINGVSQIVFRTGYNRCCYDNIFTTEKQAKSALAMAHISQIMKNDERFGGRITNEEWRDVQSKKFIIKRFSDGVTLDRASLAYNFLAFHTKEQAELFLKENEDLVKDYYMID